MLEVVEQRDRERLGLGILENRDSIAVLVVAFDSSAGDGDLRQQESTTIPRIPTS